jgi:hypothetical protein
MMLVFVNDAPQPPACALGSVKAHEAVAIGRDERMSERQGRLSRWFGGPDYVCRGAEFAGGDVLKGIVFGGEAAIRWRRRGECLRRRLLGRWP